MTMKWVYFIIFGTAGYFARITENRIRINEPT